MWQIDCPPVMLEGFPQIDCPPVMLEGFPQIDCPSVMLEGFTTDQGIFKVQTTLLNQKQVSGLAFHFISHCFFTV